MNKLNYCFLAIALFLCQDLRAQSYKENLSDSLITILQEIPESLFLEDETPYEPASEFKDNWFVHLGLGTSVYMGENDRFGPYRNRLAPAVNLAVGKWIIPEIGLRAEYSGYEARGYVWKGSSSDPFSEGAYGELIDDKYYKQKWDYRHFHGDVMLGLSNIFGGYKVDRFYSLVFYAGVGIIRSTELDKLEIAASLGLNNNFRLSEAFDLNLNIGTTMVNDRFSERLTLVNNKRMEGMATVTLGLTYKFKPRGWRGVKRTIVNVDFADRVKDLKMQLAQKPDTIVDTVFVAKREVFLPGLVINFEINKWDINKNALINLERIAKAINSIDSDQIFYVRGYADKQTGNVPINEFLSRNRANAVYNVLVNRFGVDPERLRIEYNGGVGNMFFDDNVLSRAVIFE